MRLLACWAAMMHVIAGSTAYAQSRSDSVPPPDMPLFAAFKTFCVDTGAEPSAVNAAVEAAGGKPHDPTGGSTESGTLTDTPFPLTFATWDVTVGGHRMTVSAGTGYPSGTYKSQKAPPYDFNDCSITSFANEDASVTAIRDWVGVPPQDVSTGPHNDRWTPDLTLYQFWYQVVGSTHAVLADRAQRISAETQGRSWGLMLMQSPHSASLQLVHDLPPTQ
jgi:hypothetical protein